MTPNLLLRIFRDRHGIWVHGRPDDLRALANLERRSDQSIEVARIRVTWAEGQSDWDDGLEERADG